MRDAIAAFEQALASGGAVVIRGEAGTGGEMFARALHLASNDMRGQPVQKLLSRAMRATTPNGRPFIVFDCAAVNGAERQLFGTEGDDTGPDAVEQIDEGSALHRAIGGTLVLRNLPELPGRLQARLGRVLRDGEAFVVSAVKLRRVNVRPIAVIESLDDDRVNPELRRRLSQTTITMPPLRDRKEDILPMVDFFIERYNRKFKKSVRGISDDTRKLLLSYDWPGNVRELKNAIERAMILEDDPYLRPVYLPFSVGQSPSGATAFEAASGDSGPEVLPNGRLLPRLSIPEGGTSLEEVERALVELAMKQARRNQTHAARLLDISRDALRYKLKKFGLLLQNEEEMAAS